MPARTVGAIDGVDERFKGLGIEVKEIKKTVIHIEQDHGEKLQAAQ